MVRRLCEEHGVVTSERFRSIAEEVAGRELAVFNRSDFQRVASSSRDAGSSPTK